MSGERAGLSAEQVGPTFRMEVVGFGLSEAEADALFERVADAAHALGEQVACSGGMDPLPDALDPTIEPPGCGGAISVDANGEWSCYGECGGYDGTDERCECQIIGWSRDPYEPHIPAQAEWEQADDCPVHPRTSPAPDGGEPS